MEGLSDKQQAALSLTSGILIAVGSVSIPAGVPYWIGVALALAGAVGFGIKEALGGKKQ